MASAAVSQLILRINHTWDENIMFGKVKNKTKNKFFFRLLKTIFYSHFFSKIKSLVFSMFYQHREINNSLLLILILVQVK